MALLDERTVRELTKAPKHKETLSKAAAHQGHLRLHTERYLRPDEASVPFSAFTSWVRRLIPKDKYETFLSLFRLPVQTVPLTERIYAELERVFDGRNAAQQFQFLDATDGDDWEWYRHDRLGEPDVWRQRIWPAVKTSINAFLVVDLPTEQHTGRPEPYFYTLPVEAVIDYETRDGGNLDWIIFRTRDGRVAAFDAEAMRLYDVDKDGNVAGLAEERRHGLGYCPATFLWATPLTAERPDVKSSPISSQLGNLDWLLFFSVSKRHLDLYAPYPIYSAYAADCTYQNNETGDYCDGGYLRNAQGHYRFLSDGSLMPCPVCSSKRIAGVGSFIEVPLPKEGQDLRNPVTITTVDRESLDYNTAEQQRLAEEIFQGVTGKTGDVQQKEAMNERQVTSSFETQRNVLLGLKANLERAMTFVDDTVCRLRYGSSYATCNINLGTEFYLYSAEELQTLYETAKTAGASEARLDAIADLLIETENRNNPIARQRMYILKQLEPYRHRTIEELTSGTATEVVGREELVIKLNFSAFIDRFERENINITEFGSQLPFARKIAIINEQLHSYAQEQLDRIRGNQPAAGGGDGADRKRVSGFGK
jgi:hypothetical protein